MKVESKKEFPLSQNIKEIPLFSFVRKDRQTDRQTHRQTDKHPQPCSHDVTKSSNRGTFIYPPESKLRSLTYRGPFDSLIFY